MGSLGEKNPTSRGLKSHLQLVYRQHEDAVFRHFDLQKKRDLLDLLLPKFKSQSL